MHISTLKRSNRRRQWAAWFYMRVTQGQRRRLRAELEQSGRFPIAILFYHRVADTHPNPWTISRKNFSQQLDWLERHFDIVTLREAQNRIQSRFNNRPTVALTFDDGYAENCDFAMPELARRKLPATYFVATHPVASGEPFVHDAQLHSPLRTNTIAEIQALHRQGFEIGAHTQHHVDIGGLTDYDQVRDEIVGSIEQLNRWGVGPIRYFSFPYGLPENTSQYAIDLLASYGMSGFCTAYGAWNWPDSRGYHLRRIHADPGMQTLKSWLTLDPRKLSDNRPLPFEEPDIAPSLLAGSFT
ncbi:MAG: polysaccharide deacetylase family protein [Pirellulaceae bacterium]|nr:polysaccharide deacetylase family protein [Pirellulaceae bacterium]